MGLGSFWQNQRFGRKFLLIIATAVIITCVALVVFIQVLEKRYQAKRDEAQLAVAGKFITSTMRARFNEINRYANMVSRNASLSEALYYATLAGETDELIKVSKEFVEYLQITNLEVVNSDGVIQTAVAHPDEVGLDRTDVPVIKEALAGNIKTSLHEGDGGWAIKAAAPIYNQEDLIGAVFLGSYITAETCNALKEQSGFAVAFLIEDEIIASSLTQDNGRKLGEDEKSIFNQEGVAFDRKYDGVRYRSITVPLLDDLGKKVALAIVGIDMGEVDTQAAQRIEGVILTLVVVLTIVLLISYLIARTTVAPIGDMANVVKVVAEGDLTNEPLYESKDEIGILAQDFRLMMANLRSMIGKTIASSKTIDNATGGLLSEIESTSSSTKDIAETLNTLNQGAVSQQKDIESMSAKISELNSSAQEIAAAAETTAGSANDVYKAAEEGGKAVSDTVNVMQVIKDSSGQAVGAVGRLDNEAKKIGNIVDAITSIAEQTNLLALNAAIEAARAGEQGRGFAVVADEVRKLAESSATSAGEIATLIKSIQGSIGEAVTVIEEGNTNAEKGMEVVNVAGNSLENILTLVKNITDKINDISAAAEEQSASFTEVVSSMDNVSQVANSTAVDSSAATTAINDTLSKTESLKSSSSTMKKLALELLEAMSRFKIGQEGSSKTGLKPKDS